MKICVTTTIYTHTGGLIRLYIVIWSVLSQFKWLLLFLHHAWRGHGARLSIRTKDPNNHSDTETGTLSRERVLCYEPDPGKVSKIFPAIVNQVRVLPASLIYSTIYVATRWVQSRGASSCIFVGGGIAGTGGFALMLYF